MIGLKFRTLVCSGLCVRMWCLTASPDIRQGRPVSGYFTLGSVLSASTQISETFHLPSTRVHLQLGDQELAIARNA
jgi:hypothetical protein